MANSALLRQLNQRRIIETMLRHRRASRVEISKASGVSQPTVTRIVDDLLANGVLVESPEGPDTSWNSQAGAVMGRPSKPLELDSSRARFIAIQLGVHRTRLTAVPLAISPTDHWSHSFDMPATVEEWVQKLKATFETMQTDGIIAVVASLPGVVDEAKGELLFSPNLNWTKNVNLPKIMAPFCRAPVIVLQEIRALALGQVALEPESGDFLLVDFGSGVGAAAINQSNLYSGPLPLSGELGHTPVPGNSRKCGCGSVGCVETLVSRAGLEQSAREHGDADNWADLVSKVKRDGMPDWLKKSLDLGALQISAALNILGMRQVIITGCVTEFPSYVIDHIGAAVRADTLWARYGDVTVRAAPRRRLVGMVIRAIEETLLKTE